MSGTKVIFNVRNISDFRDLMNQSAEIYGSMPAFRLREDSGSYRPVTYTEFKSDVNAMGTALLTLGVKGDKIAVIGKNSYEWCVSYMAVTCGNMVIVPIDKELMFDDIHNILEVSGTHTIFCDKKSLQKLMQDKDRIPKDMIYICFDNAEHEDGVYSFEKLLQKGRALLNAGEKEYLLREIDPEKMSALLFTSGTTGMSKGVMLSQKAICSNVIGIRGVVSKHLGTRALSVLPLHHTLECTVGFLTLIYSGISISYSEGLKYITRDLQEVKPTMMITVPLLLEKIYAKIAKKMDQKRFGKAIFKTGIIASKVGKFLDLQLGHAIFKDVHSVFGGELQSLMVGAAPINPQIVEDFKAMGIEFFIGYGLTETSPIISSTNNAAFYSDSVGPVLPGIQIKLLDMDESGVGEICVKGPNVMLGYYNMPEETEKVLDSEGWLKTGDLGTLDDKGILRIVGRIKNVIVTKNGKNIYPEEIEYYLGKSPFVSESIVAGSDEYSDDTVVVAKIFPNREEIAEFLRVDEPTDEQVEQIIKDMVIEINKTMPVYKNIKKIEIRKNAFIKTTTQKIKRFEN